MQTGLEYTVLNTIFACSYFLQSMCSFILCIEKMQKLQKNKNEGSSFLQYVDANSQGSGVNTYGCGIGN